MSLEKSLPINLSYSKYKIRELGEVLEQAYPKLLKARNFKEAKVSFAPSQMFYGSGVCPRQWYYKFQGGHEDVSPEYDAVGVFNMNSGTDAHARLQALFEAAGIQKTEEQEIKLDYPPVSGFMDSMFIWQDVEVPVEVKTSKQEGFYHKQAKMEGAMYQKMQLLLYMYILDKEVGFLFYENRNNGDWLIIPVEMSEDGNRQIIEDTIEWMKIVWDNNELPMRPFTKKSKQCKDCPFARVCWEDEPGTVDLPPLVVPSDKEEISDE